jgi:hypothetical protein
VFIIYLFFDINIDVTAPIANPDNNIKIVISFNKVGRTHVLSILGINQITTEPIIIDVRDINSIGFLTVVLSVKSEFIL